MNSRYNDALEYLLGIPMFQQVGNAALNLSLDKITALLSTLGNPHHSFRSIHVGGTNGKGSVSHLLCSSFMACGYKTGLFTSPHLFDFRERIRINGQMISRQEVIDFVDRTRPAIDSLHPSFFEVTTAMAFDCFARHGVQMAIVEVGLGGRYDATNLLHPVLSVITNIGWDHVAILGDTLEAIAQEKAGIIKKGVPVVIGESNPCTLPVFIDQARGLGASICFADHFFRCDDSAVYDDTQILRIHSLTEGFHFSLETDLCGFYQRKNICTVLCALEQLAQEGIVLDKEKIVKGIAQAGRSTNLLGRWQVLSRNPLVVCDTGHNEDGIKSVMEQLSACSYRNLLVVLGFVADKSIDRILPLFPHQGRYFFTRPSVERGLDQNILKEKGALHGLQGASFIDVNEALKQALEEAGPDDVIYVGGSTYVVADLKKLRACQPQETENIN